ncbi:MAG: 2OG-Fe(II) oxygenase [Archangium sp.]|nr:2OG-Fe(II) oxygenase [Archangium sp.]
MRDAPPPPLTPALLPLEARVRRSPLRRERETGFFIEDLVPSLLGDEATDVTARARRFVSPEVVSGVKEIRQAFHDGGRVKHVCLERALKPRFAQQVGDALEQARFRRHHHAPYRIEISPLDALRESALSRFCRWMATGDAARFHGWLAGWPDDGARLVSKQVQVARARRGDEFPLHVDTNEEGVACVYNFTRGFGADDGGHLYFPHRGRTELELAPQFNTLILFRPRNAPHGVSKVTAARGKTRFTVTAFFCVA